LRKYGNIPFLSQVTDLLNSAHNSSVLTTGPGLAASPLSLVEISTLVDQQLQAAWNWLAIVLDCTEAQLRFGSSLSASADPTHPSYPKHNKDRRNREDPALLRVLESKRKRSVGRR